jgi:GT2 family glycosyltransferase
VTGDGGNAPPTAGRRRPLISVVIATYNRGESVAKLLKLLALQTVPSDRFEAVVVDDGSAVPVAPLIAAVDVPYALHVVTQRNAGPAAARHAGMLRASAAVVVIVDDDMRVGPSFLAEHLAAHDAGDHQVVLGRLRAEPGERLPIFERWRLAMLAKLERRFDAGEVVLGGTYLYTGNVSMRRDDYFAAGGFDAAFRLSEDAELGLRLDLAGATFRFADTATAWHASDHTSLAQWMRRSAAYGVADSRVAQKHPGVAAADPWRFLFLMHPISRLPMLASALAPWLMRPVAWLAMFVSVALARLGAERAAMAGTTFAYGLQYYSGVRAHAGSGRRTLAGLARYVRTPGAATRGRAARRRAARGAAPTTT